MLDIIVLNRKDIKDALWNKCLLNATNSNIYCSTSLLDSLTCDWMGLMANNYEFIMPIPFRKKYGIYYIFQPQFCVALGVFGNQLNNTIIENFLNAIPKKFKHIYYNVNDTNFSILPNIFEKRTNYQLNLNNSYLKLKNNYNQNTKRNIKEAETESFIIKNDENFDSIAQQSFLKMKKYVAKISFTDYLNIKKIYKKLIINKNADCYSVYKKDVLIASAIFFKFNKVAYYLIVGNTLEKEKLNGASHWLIDNFIKANANTDLILDFEGSDIESVAKFYKGFGATPIFYGVYKKNTLPFWMRWFKK